MVGFFGEKNLPMVLYIYNTYSISKNESITNLLQTTRPGSELFFFFSGASLGLLCLVETVKGRSKPFCILFPVELVYELVELFYCLLFALVSQVIRDFSYLSMLFRSRPLNVKHLPS